MENALDRIEAAIARIERAARRPASEVEALQARHDRLRFAVSQSLRQLDELLVSQQK